MVDTSYLQSIIFDIVKIPSPVGDTGDVMQFINQELSKSHRTCRFLPNGNLVTTIPGNGNSELTLTLAAHVDTLGAMVLSIEDNGKLTLSKIGGFFWKIIHGENAILRTASGARYTGTILHEEASYHIDKEVSTRKWTDQSMTFRLDHRVSSRKDVEDMGIGIGDVVSFEARPIWTETGYIKSRFLDDKASVGVLMTLLRTMSTEGRVPPRTVHFLFTATEEEGLGASAGVPADTTELIGVDMGVVGKNQKSNEYSVTICAKDSATIFDVALRNHLVKLARAKNIPSVIDIFYNYGSDVFAALRAGLNARTALVGPGVHNSHGYERTHIEALSATHDLLYEAIFTPLG